MLEQLFRELPKHPCFDCSAFLVCGDCDDVYVELSSLILGLFNTAVYALKFNFRNVRIVKTEAMLKNWILTLFLDNP